MVNTRSPKQAPQLDALLKERGAHPVSYPCIDIAPPLDPTPLGEAVRKVTSGGFEWLVFTSTNAVEAVDDLMHRLDIPAADLSGVSVAAVGPGTAAVMRDRLGIDADLIPEEYVAESLAEQLLARHAQHVLVPQADRARDTLVRILSAADVDVTTVTAYRTVPGTGGDDVPFLLRSGRIDAVVFASPSAVKNMAARFAQEDGAWDDLNEICVACIGPVTAQAAHRLGLQVRVEPGDHTIPGLVEDLERYYREAKRIGG